MSEISPTLRPPFGPESSKVATGENLTASEKALQVLHAAVQHGRFTEIVTASGMDKCVLADQTEAEVRAAHTITSHAALRTELNWVSENGYAMDLEENDKDVVCVSAPIRDHLGRVRYGISVSSITLEYPNKSIETLATDVMDTARQISVCAPTIRQKPGPEPDKNQVLALAVGIIRRSS